MKIIVAEDNRVSASLLNKLLSKEGYSVINAENGKEAWDKLNSSGARILLTDWIMPEINGIELCSKIRNADLPGYTYIILLTAKSAKEDAIEGLKAGADDFITKPFDREELLTRVRTAERIISLEDKNEKAQQQLLISEKMASIGQLAAGVAHEINNPVGFISSNLKTLGDYHSDLVELISAYRQVIKCILDNPESSLYDFAKKIANAEKQVDIDYILNDIKDLVADCCEGTDRIKKIVIDMKDFAHPGEAKPVLSDINNCIESTLHLVWNEIKYKADVFKEFGVLNEIECVPQQINQIFMNILVNAAHAIPNRGEIHISTAQKNNGVEIVIKDTGTGIPATKIDKIFDPFFTTKEPGKGTGLGLHVTYNIIKKHGGTIEVKSIVGEGTEFVIWLPERMPL